MDELSPAERYRSAEELEELGPIDRLRYVIREWPPNIEPSWMPWSLGRDVLVEVERLLAEMAALRARAEAAEAHLYPRTVSDDE